MPGENLGGQVMEMGPLGKLSPSNLTTGAGGVAPKSDAEEIKATWAYLRTMK